jgi:hypothetical protein
MGISIPEGVCGGSRWHDTGGLRLQDMLYFRAGYQIVTIGAA